MATKFKVGDYARVGGTGRPMVAAYPWLKRGQLLKVKAIGGTIAGGHREYWFQGRRARPDVLLASYDLRRVEQYDRVPQSHERGLVAPKD